MCYSRYASGGNDKVGVKRIPNVLKAGGEGGASSTGTGATAGTVV